MAETKKTSSRRLGRTPEGHSRVSMNRLKILVTTVNRAKADFYMDHIQSFGEDRLPAALESLEEKFKTIAGGKGIAYTVPLKSIIGKSIFNFLSDNRSQVGRIEK